MLWHQAITFSSEERAGTKGGKKQRRRGRDRITRETEGGGVGGRRGLRRRGKEKNKEKKER